MEKVTEKSSIYNNLEKKTVLELISYINKEDQKVALAIQNVLPSIEQLITSAEKLLKIGGRFFYLGAGTGGRLSVLDKVELPNTYGIEKGIFNCLLAGGEERLLDVLEEMEDSEEDAIRQLKLYGVNSRDFVFGISASGTTPFVLAGLKWCKENGVSCGCLVNNYKTPIAENSDYPIEVVMGPEFVTGSTRMKCGTSQKMILDMLSTTLLIRLGRVKGNKMVNARLINNKVIDRSVRMLMEESGITDYEVARSLVVEFKSTNKALEYLLNKNR